MRKTAILMLASAASPRPLLACAVCFGRADPDSGLFQGLTWGLFILLGATLVGIAGLTAAVWKIEKDKTLRESAR